jgi:hypothetical protein
MRRTSRVWLAPVVALAVAPVHAAFGASTMTPAEIRQGYIKHAALAQLHRWYQIYENPETTTENQLDMLAPDIKLKSGLGEATGHDAYRQRIAQLPKTWKNAHTVTGTMITIAPDGRIDLGATLTYLNQGMRPDGSVRTADLAYTTTLQPSATVLPMFTRIEIGQLSEGTAPAFTDMYPQNRLLSLVHYWLALIEDPKRALEPFKEVLADGYALQFSIGTISDFKAFESWFRGPASAVAASTHEISNFSHLATDANTYRLQMDFDWHGILPDNKEMLAKTRHTWTVIDTPKERFARIKTVAVEVLEPFRPKP